MPYFYRLDCNSAKIFSFHIGTSRKFSRAFHEARRSNGTSRDLDACYCLDRDIYDWS